MASRGGGDCVHVGRTGDHRIGASDCEGITRARSISGPGDSVPLDDARRFVPIIFESEISVCCGRAHRSSRRSFIRIFFLFLFLFLVVHLVVHLDLDLTRAFDNPPTDRQKPDNQYTYHSLMFVAQVSRTVAPTSISSSVSGRKRTVTTKAISDANLVVGGATFASLALGRFVFLPFHRSSLAKAGMPKQNGQTHLQAGDRLAEEVTFFTNTNDPAGFSLVDVFAWGALGHAAAFYILATSSLAKSPLPF
jgi:photosystem I subunit V